MRPTALLALLLLAAPPAAARGPERRCGTDAHGSSHLLALHRYWSGGAQARSGSGAADRDEGHVAILEDRSDLVAPRNPFDLDGAALRFSPDGRGGYGVTRLAIPPETAGDALGLGDDEARSVGLPFAFPFYGKNYTQVILHSDGHLTFGAPDTAPSERGLARFLSGPPRIAPFFADLDPSRGGRVSARIAGDRAVFLWTDVPGSGQINRNSFQVALRPDGSLEMAWGSPETREAVVGLSPGEVLDVTPVDLSAGVPGAPGALAERFSETERVDLVSLARRFYTSHPDVFDQLVVYTTRPLNPIGGTLAFEITVKNEIEGIGLGRFDDAAQWGSAGRLSSLVYMDAIDPYLDVDGFEILGHEVGHRWLAYQRFRDPSGEESRALLGRGDSHWSFFFDSDASVMEGNDIETRGGGRFETVDFARGYSALDQYAMGLRAPEEVQPFFYVAEPDNFRPNRPYKSSSAPEAGVSFSGVRREVRIQDVVAALGPRVPDAAHSPRLVRQAYVLVADAKASATEERRRAVARIRARFEEYYREATGGRGIADSTLP